MVVAQTTTPMQRAACIRDGLALLRDAPSLAAIPPQAIADLLRALAVRMPLLNDGSNRPAPSTLLVIAMGSTVFFAPRLGVILEPHHAVFAAAAQTLVDAYLGAADDEVVDDAPFVHAFTAWFLHVGASAFDELMMMAVAQPPPSYAY